MKIGGFDFKSDIFLLDSNALMIEHFRSYVKNELVKAVSEYRQSSGESYYIYVPATVKEELESLTTREGSDALHKRTEALKAYDVLEDLVTKGFSKIAKSDFTGVAKGFNDVAVLTMMMELRRYSNVSILTNDRDFATDLLNLNLLRSVRTKKMIRAFYIDKRSLRLKDWKLDSSSRLAER